MATPTIPNGETQFFPILYEGNGAGQKVGKFVPFTDSGTIANSVLYNDNDSPYLTRTQESGSGDQKRKATFSWWFKRGSSFGTEMIHVGAAPSTRLLVRFDTSDRLVFRLTNGTTEYQKVTNRTFQDTSKWYHCHWQIDVSQSTATDRSKVWIDGDQITSWNADVNPGQNTDVVGLSDGTTQRIGCGAHFVGQIFDGYLAEFNYCDGVITTVDNFGVTDTSTGRWIPKTLSGITYGTNGFRLKFQDSSALGDDTSGNTNDFTATNLASTDQTTDSPTQNFTILSSNQTAGSPTLSEGNLVLTAPSSNYGKANGSLGFEANTSTGLYWEVLGSSSISALESGIIIESQGSPQTTAGQVGGYYIFNRGAGGGNTWWVQYNDDQQADTGVSWANNDKIGVAIKNGNLWFAINNTWVLSGNPATGANPIFTGLTGKYRVFVTEYNSNSVTLNPGSKSFTYTAPTGFVALQQDNLPETAKGITGVAWAKSRDAVGQHVLRDSSRGLGTLFPSLTSAESQAPRGITKFLKGGYALGEDDLVGGSNNAGESFVSWNWVANSGTTASNTDGSITSTVQANTTAGFSIIEATAAASGNFTIGHGLSSAPDFFWLKMTGTTGNWVTFHHSIATTSGEYVLLDTTGAMGTAPNAWGAALPTSSVIGLGAGSSVTGSQPFVIHAWHEVLGFSKFGKYVGNGNADGPFVYTGFRPAMVMVKSSSNAATPWEIRDNKRSASGSNPITQVLYPNLSSAEVTTDNCDFLSNGFKWRSSGGNRNESGYTYIYMAWAEHPFVGDGTNPVTAR